MSAPTMASSTSATERAIHAILKPLLPLFLAEDHDKTAARAAALAALRAYQPDTLTDYLTAARAIAFSFGAIAATATALDPALSAPQQLRCLTRANSFARLAQRAETALETARRHRPANAAPRAPEPELPLALPTAPEEKDALRLTLINQAAVGLRAASQQITEANAAASTQVAHAGAPASATTSPAHRR